MSTSANSKFNQKSNASEKVSFIEKIGYGSGDFAANLLFHTWNLFLLKFYVDVFGISATAAGTMFFVTRIIDIISDPIIGILADKTRTRWGRYRPWILIGAIPLGVTGYLMFITPDWSENSKLIFAWISYSLAMLLYTIVQIPYSALMGVMTSDAKQRTQISSFRFFFSFAGQMIIGACTIYMIQFFGTEGNSQEINAAKGYQLTMGIFMILATLLYMFTFLSTKERISITPNSEQPSDIFGNLLALLKNFGWLIFWISGFLNLIHVGIRNGTFLFYFDYYVGDETKISLFFTISSLFFLVGIVAANFLSQFVNKRFLLLTLSCLVGFSACLFYFIPSENYYAMIAIQCMAALFAGPIPVLTYVFYAEIADHSEWKTGRKMMALIFSTMLTGVKLGLVVGGSFAAWYLDSSGYKPNTEQSTNALNAIVLLVSIIPGIFAILSGLILYLYPFSEKEIAQAQQELKQRRDQEDL